MYETRHIPAARRLAAWLLAAVFSLSLCAQSAWAAPAAPARAAPPSMTLLQSLLLIALLIAAMSADGTSRIDNIEQIDRRYEHIEDRLNALGAKITRA